MFFPLFFFEEIFYQRTNVSTTITYKQHICYLIVLTYIHIHELLSDQEGLLTRQHF